VSHSQWSRTAELNTAAACSDISTTKQLYQVTMLICLPSLLLEVQRIPELDVVDVQHDVSLILRFRFLAEDLDGILIRYSVNGSDAQIPAATSQENSDDIFSVTIREDCPLDMEEQRQCKELRIEILGRPGIHASSFVPVLTDLSQPNTVRLVETDKFFRINYLGEHVMLMPAGHA